MRAAIPSLRRRLFASLASRIGFFVFAATLASALAVAFTSALAVRAFLRDRVQDRIPEAAARARDQLELWYTQRALDVEVFSHSEIIGDLARGDRAQSRVEAEQYLSYVRSGLPVYSSIFALDASGRVLAHIGGEFPVGPALAQRIARVDATSISGVLGSPQGPVQLISARVATKGGARVSLHAVLPIRALGDELARGVGENAGRLHVYDESGALVASSQPAFAGELAEGLREEATTRVVDYLASDRVRVVASAQRLERLPWRVVFEGDYGATFAPIASILTRMVGLNLGIVVVLAGVAFAIAWFLLRPLHQLSEAAVRLRDGETDIHLPIVSADHEVGVLARSFAEMVESLTSARARLEQLAITDGLTCIHNHRFFQDRLSEEILAVDAHGGPLTLILLDIDDFKQLNDRFGHATGDAVLEDLALLLTGNARAHDIVARYGGEEFAVLCPGLGVDAAVALAEQMRLAVHSHRFRVAGADETLPVTVSIGVSSYHGDRVRFFADADRALYAAKHAGKDCVHCADEA